MLIAFYHTTPGLVRSFRTLYRECRLVLGGNPKEEAAEGEVDVSTCGQAVSFKRGVVAYSLAASTSKLPLCPVALAK